MKRYVKEFANDVLRRYDNNAMMPHVRQQKKERIESVLSDYDNGLTTSTEAVYTISRVALGY